MTLTDDFGNITLPKGGRKESTVTTQWLGIVRAADPKGFRYKIGDIGNTTKVLDVIFFSKKYGSGSIEIKVHKNKRPMTKESLTSQCEPHQVGLLHKFKTMGFISIVAGYSIHTKEFILFPR